MEIEKNLCCIAVCDRVGYAKNKVSFRAYCHLLGSSVTFNEYFCYALFFWIPNRWQLSRFQCSSKARLINK